MVGHMPCSCTGRAKNSYPSSTACSITNKDSRGAFSPHVLSIERRRGPQCLQCHGPLIVVISDDRDGRGTSTKDRHQYQAALTVMIATLAPDRGLCAAPPPPLPSRTWCALQMRSRSCCLRNCATTSSPKVNDTPRSLSPQPMMSLSGSAHSRSHSRPVSGSKGNATFFVSGKHPSYAAACAPENPLEPPPPIAPRTHQPRTLF
jgi:hypothetical protein